MTIIAAPCGDGFDRARRPRPLASPPWRLYAAGMDTSGLDQKLVAHWRSAAEDLGIRVTAPVELTDSSGQPFACEAFVHDFGSPSGAVVVSRKTSRRVRHNLRSLGDDVWVCGGGRRQAGQYVRKHYIDELLDWGWFGKAGEEPGWYSERMPRQA